ncbi:MAG: SusC/RagA family TonB-linked outer membrane protein [Bacteroides sp.]|nr:SusC/RagA family TonB-linked outer membrane protein [Bacteroides sp.]
MTLVACSWAAMAQTTYRGTVVDAENNEPLIGATIMPIGGGQGAATDIDGKYSISVPKNVTTAKVTYVGYKEQVVKLTNNMTIKLVSTEQNLDDLVVVAYGTATKESLTGSVAVVGSKEIEERPVTSVTSALEGNAPGVQVNNSTGTPGSAPDIRIRGFNSINGSNSPLYVVDGVPYEGTIADLNPADIESMSVLKDAASCALYGNRGANGVILITTKRAKNVGKVDVTLQIRQGMYNRGLPFYDRLDANDWMQMMFNSVVNGETRNNLLNSGGKRDKAYYVDYYAKGAIIKEKMYNNIYGVPNNELFIVDPNDPTKATFFGGSILPGYTDLDWWDAVSRNGYRQEYNVNATGATDKFNMFASVGYLKENGYMLQTDFERFNGRVNVNYQPTSYLRMGMNFALTQQNSETGQDFANDLASVANPFLTMFTAPIYPYYQHDADGNIMYDEFGQPIWNTAGSYLQGNNVAWAMRLDKNDFNKTAIDGNVYATAVIPYGFELTFRGQMSRTKTIFTQYNNNIIGSQAGVGMLQKEFDELKSHTFSQTLTWSHEYGNNHIDALLSHENQSSSIYYDFILKADQVLDNNYLLNNFSELMQDASGGQGVNIESYLGRVRYNYDQKYFGEVSLRRDGSSRFSKNHRWGTFWSVGASWIITKERFMEPTQSWLNYLKLRAAYGTVGNDVSAPYYSYMNLFSWSQYNNIGTLLPNSLGSPDLKWESTKTFDIGLEGSMFDDRFTFSVGYFNKQNSDLLFNYTLPASMGSLVGSSSAGSNPSVWRNVGTMQNTGWELQFGYDIIRNRDWKWNFSIDATFIKNKITKLPNNQSLPSQNLFLGESRYIIKTYTFAGVDQLTGQSMYYIDPMSPDFMYYDESGAMKYDNQAYLDRVQDARDDKNAVFIEKDGKYYTSNMNNASRVIHGSALPVVYGSFGTNASWKGINLGLLFTYSLGGKTLDSNYMSLMSSSSMAALHKDVLKSWTQPADHLDANGQLVEWVADAVANGTYTPGRIDPNGIPEINSNYSGTNNASSSRFITSSNYLCLKNINVSYDFPRSWVDALKMQGLNLGFSCDNVFLVTRRKGMNPTYGFGGGQGANYVPARVFAFQLTAKF